MIQNRITTVDSGQPFCSKWWCSGAMRNTRLPDSRNEVDLHDHRGRFEHEQAADNGEHQLVLGGDGDGAERAAERQASRYRP